MNPSHQLPFRTDINGLRAWAVLAVLAYHFSYLGLPGGFVGVDIFFVISGYLMTAIVLAPQPAQTFSLLSFYAARLRRILPALLVLIALLLAWGWFALLPNAYQGLGEQSAAALGFISNLYLWQSVGYFDVGAHEKWLLHTWSLAIEAQFYLLYPVVLLCWQRCGQRFSLRSVLLLLFTLSLAANLYLSLNHQASTAFYWLPSRAWELLAGGLVYALGAKGVRPLYFYVGWLLLLISLFGFNSQLLWPSYWALLPVVGTSLILWSNHATSLLTQANLLQWLGNRSYSLYLWHWPMVVALYYVNQAQNVVWVISAIGFSLLMAHLSYTWVERPSQRWLSQWHSLTQGVLLVSIAAALAYAGYQLTHSSWPSRLPPAVLNAAAEANNKPDSRCFVDENGQGERGCVFGGEPKLIIAGDSHARALRSAAIDSSQNSGVLFWGMSGCPTIANALFSPATGRKPTLCAEFNQQLIHQLQSQHLGMPLLLISRTSLAVKGYNELINGQVDTRPFIAFDKVPLTGADFEQAFTHNLVETACTLAHHRPVYLLRPIPEMGIDVPGAVSKNLMFGLGKPRVSISLEDYHARHRFVWQAQDLAAAQCGVRLLDPLPYLCDSNHCYGDHNGRPIYFDDDHLSEFGNQLLKPLFAPLINPNTQ